MTREALIEAVKQEVRQHGVKIYIGRNDRTTLPEAPKIHYTDDFEEGPYFYGADGAFQIMFRYAMPIGVAGPKDTAIFWSDLEEAFHELKSVLP